MGIPREELLTGMSNLLVKLGLGGERVCEGDVTRFEGPEGIEIEVGPMPEERIDYPALFPRTLVVLRGEESALESFSRRIAVAFLRPTG